MTSHNRPVIPRCRRAQSTSDTQCSASPFFPAHTEDPGQEAARLVRSFVRQDVEQESVGNTKLDIQKSWEMKNVSEPYCFHLWNG